MVLVRRHQAKGNAEGFSQHDGSSLSVAPGKAISPVSNISSHFFSAKKTPIILSSKLLKVVLLVLVVSWLPGILAILRARSALQQVQYAYDKKQEDREAVLQTLNDAEEARRAIQQQVNDEKHTGQVLKHEVKIMSEMEETLSKSEKRREKKKGVAQHDALVEWLQERHEVLEEKVENLKKQIQEESRRAVIKKYGSEPRKVKISVKIGDESTVQTVVLEMAPLDEVPHAINVFLDMVSKGLWNSCFFSLGDNGDHALIASPLSSYSGESRISYFESAGIDKLSFPDYSPRFPHEVGTVGFSKLGPSFFINTKDNVIPHGPGGQAHHELPEDAEPCFAKVVEGMDVVTQMQQFKGSIKNNGWSTKSMSRIIKAEVM